MSREDSGVSTFTAAEALAIHRLVKLNGTTERSIVYADAGDDPIGVTKKAVINGDTGTPVWLLNGKPGTITCIANSAIAVNAPVWPVEDGKIDDFGLGDPIGWALKATTADGDHVEVLRNCGANMQSTRGVAHVIEDDFHNYVNADKWTLVGSDGGTVAIADGVGGTITIDTGATTDNLQLWLEQKLETFKFAAGKPLYFQARVKNTEVGSDVVNWLVGLMDGVADDALQDDGAGPKASYSGAVFFVVDGGTVVQVESSIAGAQVTDTDVGARTDAVQMKLEIMFIPTTSTVGVVHFIYNGVLVASNAITFTSATEMQIAFGVKNGGAGGSVAQETLDIDYVYCAQVR